MLLIPFIQPKFAVLPVFFLWINFNKKKVIPLFLAIVLFLIFAKPFFGQTIFKSDYEAGQQVLQQQKLYPTIFLARLFQNKARIPLEKVTDNFFALTDPNNYFFGFAPGQIKIDNQNLEKFTFLALPFLLIGLYSLSKNPERKILVSLLIATIINLSLLKNFDRNDFVLWTPLFLIIVEGLNTFDKQFKYAKYYELIFIMFSLIEITRLFL